MEGKDGQNSYQEQHKPPETQNTFCQTGKKGVGAAEILGGDSWIHGFASNSSDVFFDRINRIYMIFFYLVYLVYPVKYFVSGKLLPNVHDGGFRHPRA
jgi:hypothetical protein